MNQPTIELVCRKADVHIFMLLGFTLASEEEGHGGTHMVHRDPSSPVVATLLQIGANGRAFAASVAGTAFYGGMVMAGDGTRFGAAPAIGDCRHPVVRVEPDGTLDGLERAMEYWTVQASFIASLPVHGTRQ